MGVCASCLGHNRDRERELSDEDESTRLLFDDPNGNYGSFGDNHVVIQADPQEILRETEALQKVVAQTSNHLVDIFALVPQNCQSAASTVFPAHGVRILQYKDVLSKISTQDQSNSLKHVSAENTPNVSDGWMSEDEDVEEMHRFTPVKSEGIGPLLGGFADADTSTE